MVKLERVTGPVNWTVVYQYYYLPIETNIASEGDLLKWTKVLYSIGKMEIWGPDEVRINPNIVHIIP